MSQYIYIIRTYLIFTNCTEHISDVKTYFCTTHEFSIDINMYGIYILPCFFLFDILHFQVENNINFLGIFLNGRSLKVYHGPRSTSSVELREP